MKKFKFNDSDKELIRKAVEQLEKESAGELVLYFARKSDGYSGASWKFAAIAGGLSSFLLIVLSYLWLLPPVLTPIAIGATLLGIMIACFLITLFDTRIRLSFIPNAIIQHRVLTKARDIFLQEEVFNTKDRIGILIYISELEQQVVVLGDSGINQKIEQSDWKGVVNEVVTGIKENKVASGIVNAVEKCKNLLLAHEFTVRADDKNELSDDIRIEK